MSRRVLEAIVRIHAKGVIIIPKRIREAVGLKDGDFVRVTAEKGRIFLEPVRVLPYKNIQG